MESTASETVDIDDNDDWIPQHEQKTYKFLIWQEDVPEKEGSVRLHLVKRNNSSFRQVSKIKKDEDKCWIFRDNLPNIPSLNQDIKAIVRHHLAGGLYGIKGNVITTRKSNLPLLESKINLYLDSLEK